VKAFVVRFGVSCTSANLISYDTEEVVAFGCSGWIGAEKKVTSSLMMFGTSNT